MVGFGIEKIGYESPNQPLTLAGEWVIFANETGAKMAAMLLESLICEDFKVVDLSEERADDTTIE